MYRPHPSAELNAKFAARPYQGVEPSAATFLFVGLDANYSLDLEQSPSFRRVLEYHEDGVAFWQRYGVHHPFLLPEYRGDGRRYHRTFARIGLNLNTPLSCRSLSCFTYRQSAGANSRRRISIRLTLRS
jgi:hypothetical protein